MMWVAEHLTRENSRRLAHSPVGRNISMLLGKPRAASSCACARQVPEAAGTSGSLGRLTGKPRSISRVPPSPDTRRRVWRRRCIEGPKAPKFRAAHLCSSRSTYTCRARIVLVPSRSLPLLCSFIPRLPRPPGQPHHHRHHAYSRSGCNGPEPDHGQIHRPCLRAIRRLDCRHTRIPAPPTALFRRCCLPWSGLCRLRDQWSVPP